MSTAPRGVRPGPYSDLLRPAADAGVVERGRGGHLKVRVPGGGLVVAAVSPSNRRAHLELRSQLRRAGVEL